MQPSKRAKCLANRFYCIWQIPIYYYIVKKRWKFPPHWWENYTLYHYHHGGFACGEVLHYFECVITTRTSLVVSFDNHNLKWACDKHVLNGAKQPHIFRVSFCSKSESLLYSCQVHHILDIFLREPCGHSIQ